MSIDTPRIPAVVSLQHIVANFLNERNDYSMAEYKRLLQMAVMGFSNLNMTTLRSYDVAYVDIDSKGQGRMPDDFVDYTKVGVNLGGKLFVISFNKEVIINRQTESGDILNEAYNADDNVPDNTFLFMPHTRNGLTESNLYGYSYGSGMSSFIPMFNIDYENKIIQLSSTVSAPQLIVEYISTGVSLSGNTFIPRYCETAMVEYLHWRTRKNDYKASRGAVIDAKQDYLEAVAELQLLEEVPTYQEIMDVLYSTSSQTPRR